MSDFFLADDLSGALDAAAAFHRAGWPVTIALSIEAWYSAASGGIVGFTTESRNASAEVAARAVTRALAHGRARGGRLLYKKIDSTLRGPVAAELAALAAALPEARILFSPANPAVGRTVRDGVLLVRGVPVGETEFARDPVSPVTESRIVTLLGAAASARVVVADAANEHDLTEAVARMTASSLPWVAVGSGALARPVAQLLSENRNSPGTHCGVGAARLLAPGSCLLVCGSAHAGNRAQAAVLMRERGVPRHELSLADAAGAVARSVASIRAGGGASLLMEEGRGDSGRVVRTLAQATAAIVRETNVSRVFVTGGETAFAICSALGIRALEFVREIESGLSLSRAPAPVDTLLAIKPGGFGDAHTWVRAWDALRLE